MRIRIHVCLYVFVLFISVSMYEVYVYICDAVKQYVLCAYVYIGMYVYVYDVYTTSL